MATATLTYVTGVNAATNYVRVGHNSNAINNDAVWSFSLSEAGTNKFTSVSFKLTWNNTSAGTGWSGSYSYRFAVTTSGSAGRTAHSATSGYTNVTLSGSSGTATFTISSLSLTPGTTYYLRGNFNGSTYSTMKAFAKSGNTITGTTRSLLTYTVSYKKGSNGTGTDTTATKTYGTALTLKGATFTRTGYYQSGWATSDGGSQAYALSASYTTNAAITLYPVWTSYKATVTYNVNGGSITTGTGTTRYRVSGSTVQVSENSGSTWANLSYSFGIDTTYPNHWNVGTYGATRTGYYITGTEAYGTTSSGGILINQDYSSSSTTNAATVYRMNGNANLTANKSFTLYIHWKPNTYTVTLNANGGSSGTTSVTATYDAAMPSATMPSRPGYTFQGFYDTSAASGGTQYYTAAGASARTWNKTSNTTLYARWTLASYNLTLNCTQGSYQILPYDRDISNWENFRLDENSFLAKNKDGYFSSGVNGVSAYNFGDGTATVTRVSKQGDNPFTDATYELQVAVSKDANANARKGFVQSTTSAASKIFQHIFVAKLPIGYKFQWAANATGDNRVFTWLTPQDGTGDYQVYAYQLNCGSSGTFSTFGHVYVQTDDALNLTFYVAYSEMFDISPSQVFSIPYNTIIEPPVPIKPGYKFMGWGRSFNGSQQAVYGRDMFYTDKLSVHLQAYMENWSLYNSTPMRVISCTESGGWNIEQGNNDTLAFIAYDSGASAYKYTYSTTTASQLSPGWHTFDMTFVNKVARFYIDEELEGTSETFTGNIGYHASNGLFLGCEAAASQTTGTSPYFTGHVISPLIFHHNNAEDNVARNTYQFNMPGGNWSLTSYWISDSQEATLTLDTDGGTISQNSITDAIGTLVTLPIPTKPGYKFNGWYYDLDGYKYAALPRNLTFGQQISVHCDIYLDDWSEAVNGTPMLSWTEGGGWNLYPDGNNYMASYAYDSGASGYKGFTDDVLVNTYSPGWHSFDMVFTGTYWQLYIDNELAGQSEAFTSTISYQSYNDLLVGAEATGVALGFDSSVQFFKGKVANLRVINSNSKISNLDITQAHIPAVDATLVALWEESSSYIKIWMEDTPSQVTELTNTTWVINDTPDIYYFGEIKEWNINFNCDDVNYDCFAIDETWVDYGLVYYTNRSQFAYIDVYDFSEDSWINNKYKTIHIIGGADTSNSELLQWLKANATFQSFSGWKDIRLQTYIGSSRLTDLTGTTWYMNETVDAMNPLSGSDEVIINMKINNISISNLWIEEGYIWDDDTGDWYEDPDWGSSDYRNWQIIDGNDVTRSDFINWMYENGTLISPIPSPYQTYPVKIYTSSGWQIVQL